VHDVCVIGSGFAGLFVALALVERGIDTIVVEAGGPLPLEGEREGATALFPHASRGQAACSVDANRSIGIGGTSNKWNGVVTRLLPTDLRTRSEFGIFDDWPIAYDEVGAHYPDAERALALDARAVPLALPAALAEWEFAAMPFSLGRDGVPVRLGAVEAPRLARSACGTLLSHRPVTRIVPADRTRISHVETRAPGGDVEAVQARYFVIAAGVLETARLLLVSRCPAFPRGLGNALGLVGRHVHAHPRFRFSLPRAPHLSQCGGVHRSYAFADDFRRKGLGAICLDTNLSPDPITVDVTVELEPSPDNRIELGDRADAWGRPVPVLIGEWTEVDTRTLAAGRRVHERLAHALAGHDGPLPAPELTWFHPAGGCRMAADERRGVVDAHGRVFGLDNLFVLGASTFPTSGPANPTLTIVALALRLGARLAGLASRR
jgi:choline dehydrogenase-like flavoprotein